MSEPTYLQWPVFRRSVVAAFERSLTLWRSIHLFLRSGKLVIGGFVVTAIGVMIAALAYWT
jgi:hypothetical protein